MDKLLEILAENCPTVDFDVEKELITAKVIDSIDLVSIISDIEDAFDISIDMEEIEPENFDSVEAIWALIQKLQ
ncbi:MAG: acyl carrier protein [Lachnospiraceae bacterium]|nr:acyl carrier protein [Lachnospiraceae bacterium]